MAVDNDPSVECKNKGETHGHAMQIRQHRMSKTHFEEFTSQNQEREWVDTLLDNSPQDESLDSFLNCVSWEEAAIGWRLTIPNVTYISRISESNSTKDADKEKENLKNRTSQKLNLFDRDQSWKQCVEPVTYRYIHKSAHGGTVKKKVFNKGPVKRPMDAHLQEHIRKVKEHLQKVLVQQASPRVHQRPLGTVHNYGDYVSSLIREAKPNRSQPQHVTRYSPRPNKSVDDQVQIQTNVPDVGLTYTVKRSSPVQKSPHPHNHHPAPKTKTPNDLVAAVGHKLNELIQQDSFKTRTKTTNQSQQNTEEKMRSSYEKFPTFTIPAHVGSPLLNPLVRVTPGQRKVHDDNEIIGAVAKMNKQVDFQSGESCSSFCASPTPSKENQNSHHGYARTGQDDVHNSKCEQWDPLNKNFFSCGITGKAVSPTDIHIQTHLSNVLNNAKNTAKVKKRGTLRPQKQGHVPQMGRGDHGMSITNRLGDPLHRGVMDRETAGAIASELLPGVSGHKIRFPLHFQAYRII